MRYYENPADSASFTSQNPAEDVELRTMVELYGFSLDPNSPLMKYCRQREEQALRDLPAQLDKLEKMLKEES